MEELWKGGTFPTSLRLWLGFYLKPLGRCCLHSVVLGLSSEEIPELLPTKPAREFSTGTVGRASTAHPSLHPMREGGSG